MSREPDQPTAAEDYGPARTVITLPVPGPKGPLKIEIQAATVEELVPILQGLPGAGRDTREQGDGRDPLEMTLEFLARHEDRAKEIVERWATSPPISFNGPKPGHIEWRKLHLQNRIAIVNGITLFSQTGSAGEAERFATFPPQQLGGASNGGGVGRAGEETKAGERAPAAASASRGG